MSYLNIRLVRLNRSLKFTRLKAVVIIILLLPVFSIGQLGNLKYADKLYNSLSYYYAADAYENFLERKNDSLIVAKNLAVCYDKTGNTLKAIEWYRFLEKNSNLDSKDQLRLALLEREVGNYKVSEGLMSDYNSKYGELDVSKSIIASNTNIDALLKGTNNFELKTQEVNSDASEIGASFYGNNQMIIASSKRKSLVSNTISSWTGSHFYDIYITSIDENGNLGKMKRIKSKIQSKYNDGPAVFDEVSGYFYFTRNNYLNGKKGMDSKKVTRLKIYRAKLDGSKFKNIEELSINSDSYSTAHPVFSKDGKTMYFSSDRPGGLGGMDIYSVKIDDKGTFGEPLNLGSKVNTTQDEVFPSYNNSENILFFSSDGHAGLGGLDIFAAKLNKLGSASSIENLGAPINSSVDDLSYLTNEEQTGGYFSSNRIGGKGDDDIYGFKQLKPIKNSAILFGNTKDLLTGQNIENATIYIADYNGNILDSTKSEINGDFELSLNEVSDDFKLIVSKDDYTKGTKEIAYNNSKMEYREEVKLMPILDYIFVGSITDREKGTPISGVSISIIDNNNNQLFETVTTQENGEFKTSTLPYSYDDKITYNFKIVKEGYIGKTIGYEEVLAMKEELNVNKNLELKLTKLEKGADVSADLNLLPIYFDLNKSNIRPDAAIELDKVVKFLQENPTVSLELGSHTDSRGSNAANLSLSSKRAKSSASYIVSRGIGKDRITGKGYGETKLIVQDANIEKASTEEMKELLHQKNRRTEFIIVKMK